MTFTIFTPTYNRAHLLPRLYNSLCRQSFRDFEWICVDDGSTDNTQEVMEKLMEENVSLANTFPIRYYKKKNGGKHTAINKGIQVAKGELFFIADSDDLLPPNALKSVFDIWESIKDDSSFGGVCGFDKIVGRDEIIGSGFPNKVKLATYTLPDKTTIQYIDGTNISIRFGLGITGDMKEVFRTSVLREFPFPEIDREKFCPEVLVWNRIATKYKLRYINQAIYIADYQKNGITFGITKARMNSPVATTTTYREMVDYNVPVGCKIKASINYWRFYFCLTDKPYKMKEYRLGGVWQIFSPVGYAMHILDKLNIK